MEQEDPGLVFIISTEAKVHACLALRAVHNLSPVLQQGWSRKKYFNTHYSMYFQGVQLNIQ